MNSTFATPSSPAEATHQGTNGWNEMSVMRPIEWASSFFHTYFNLDESDSVGNILMRVRVGMELWW
jgi:hypothetical protein